MAFYRGEEGSVSFDNGSGSVGAIASTTSWSLDVSKDVLECTAHGATSRSYVGSLVGATGSVELMYTATSGDNTAEIVGDVLTTEDPGDAAFNLFLENYKSSYSFVGLGFWSRDPSTFDVSNPTQSFYLQQNIEPNEMIDSFYVNLDSHEEFLNETQYEIINKFINDFIKT